MLVETLAEQRPTLQEVGLDETLSVNRQEILEQSLARVVSGFRFDILWLYDDLISSLENGVSIFESYERWQPDVLGDTLRHRGSDCFGLAAVLQNDLVQQGIYAEIFPLGAEGLAEEAVEITQGIGSVGLFVPEDEGVTLLCPDYALTKPIPLTPAQNQAELCSDGRTFNIKIDFARMTGQFSASSNYNSGKEMRWRLESIDQAALPGLQKAYVQIRPSIHCDRFDQEGNKIAGLKINLLKDAVVISQGGARLELDFQNWRHYDWSQLAQTLDLDSEVLENQVATIIRRAGQIRALWPESLKRKHLEMRGVELEDKYHPWNELKEQGVIIGGLLAFIVNSENQILLYEIPETMEKPHIGRFKGQLNTVVETARVDQNQLPVEEFEENLARGIEEELTRDFQVATQLNLVPGSYREVLFGQPEDKNKAIARCCVLNWKGTPNALPFSFQKPTEGGQWQWHPIDEALGYEIEPNVRPILEKYLLEGLI